MRPTLWAALVLSLGMALGGGGVLAYVAANAPARGTPPSVQARGQVLSPQGQPGAASQAVIAVYEQVSPAVVNITFTALGRDVFGSPLQRQGTGSGFVIDDQGHVATNHHVVGGATRLDITLADGTSHLGELVGVDPANDLAVVRILAPAEVLRELAVASLGDSESLRVGETVVAIGNPFGLERSASVGIVSSLGRTRPGETERLIPNMIQTDAAINPGNSGGPLLNLQGEVVGINEQIEALGGGNVGVGFAVPVNALKRYLPDLLASREPQHAWLGIAGRRLTPTLAQQLQLSLSQGVLLETIVPGGPAATAGLRGAVRNNPATADVLTEIDGRPMRSVEDVAGYIDALEPGQRVQVSYLRSGQMQATQVALGAWQRTGLPVR